MTQATFFSPGDGLSETEYVAVGATTSNRYSPALAIDDAGNVAALWKQGQDLVATLRPAGSGMWEGEQFLTIEPNLYLDKPPELHVLGDGNFLASWVAGTDASPEIWSSHFVVGGAWSAPRFVGTAADAGVELMSISTTESGEAIAVWVGTEGLQMNRFSLEGESWDDPISLIDGGSLPQVVLGADGSATLSWLELSTDTKGALIVANLPIEGDTLEVALQITASSETVVKPPQLSADLDGNLFLVWSESGTQGTTLWSSRYDRADEEWGFPASIGQVDGPAIDFELRTNQVGQSFVAYFSKDPNLVEDPENPVALGPLAFTRYQ
jgi:hypothetical protein